ncbi:MAG: hypothetical protein IPM47_20520 [Sphingobacteriales bacterium]|nr:MAG: hypothetical protein IPM47_20520 [Sphingobacteriales bacterium]
MYSFFGACKKQNINLLKWSTAVLKVFAGYSINKLEELLPGNLEIDKDP